MKRFVLSLVLLVAVCHGADDSKFLPFSLEDRKVTPAASATLTLTNSSAEILATTTNSSPTNSAPITVAGVVVDDRHKLVPGDKLSFQVLEDRDEPKSLVVTDSGELDVPYVGRVKVAGRTCKEVGADLKVLLEKDYYYRATVVLGLDQISRVLGRVYVWGEVRNQGPVEIPANENFTAGKAILRAGGFNDWAKRSKVKVVRAAKTDGGTKEEIIVDMDAVLKEGNTEADVPLQADDFIIVPRSKVNF
jgi:protein involved in polysaccharide export with SLBB domain